MPAWAEWFCAGNPNRALPTFPFPECTDKYKISLNHINLSTEAFLGFVHENPSIMRIKGKTNRMTERNVCMFCDQSINARSFHHHFFMCPCCEKYHFNANIRGSKNRTSCVQNKEDLKLKEAHQRETQLTVQLQVLNQIRIVIVKLLT